MNTIFADMGSIINQFNGVMDRLQSHTEEKQGLAGELAHRDLGATASSVMSGCEKYGMTWGCDTDCPVLRAGECELKDDVNKKLWLSVQTI